MTQTPITELDFFQIKDQLKSFLGGQTQFKDYNFEGSNMSVLLDVLAYNTYQNNFYTNMAFSEMFLDSALKESSVMSQAKELNYLPQSATSARAQLNVTINNSVFLGSTILIPANTKFTTSYNGMNYNFYNAEAYNAVREGSTTRFTACCVEVFEGDLVTEIFHLSATKTSLVLNNSNADISSIKVFVNTEEYLFRSSIFGVSAIDKIFYIEPSLNGNYSVTFGRNKFGLNPSFNDDIAISYRIASGIEANGSTKFATSFRAGVTVITFMAATGGTEKESIESIKYFAPKSIQNQERAVTASDYAILLKKQFGSSVIKSVSVYGGDEMDPPRYGKVAISVNPYGGTTISDGFKSSILSFLADKTPLPIQPVFVDPEFLYAKIDINAYYSYKTTSKSAAELEALIRNSIISYSNIYLDDFGSVFQLSRLSSIIDGLDVGILSNTIEANPIIDYSPPVNIFKNPQFNFNTSLITPYTFNEVDNIDNYIPAIKSSIYTAAGVNTFFQDDGRGNIITLSSNIQKIQVLNPTVGTVDYALGTLKLINFKVDNYTGDAIKIYANTVDKNIISPKNRVFSIRDKDVTVNMIETN